MFRRALLTAGFIGGPMVEEFEKAFAAFCGANHSIADQQRYGCAALRHHGLRSAARRRGLTVPHTFIATTEAISQAGAMPEFVDIDERHLQHVGRDAAAVPGRAVHAEQVGETHQPCGVDGR